MTRPPYDGSDEARRAHARLLAARCRAGDKADRSPLPGGRPTPDALERHARRFGPEQVAETAAELGVEVDVSDVPKPKRSKIRRKR